MGGSEGRRLASREQGAGAKGWPRAGSIDAGPAVGEERRSHGRGATVAAGRSRATSQGARQAARRERRPRTSRGRGAAKPARPRAFAWPDHPRLGSSKRQAASGYPSSGIAARRRRQRQRHSSCGDETRSSPARQSGNMEKRTLGNFVEGTKPVTLRVMQRAQHVNLGLRRTGPRYSV